MRTSLRAAAAALTIALSALPAAAKPVGSSSFEGNIVHISTDNIKVAHAGQTVSFLLVPHFDQVFAADGKTTYQMAKLHSGQLVKVYYDQKALGARHADRILLLDRAEQPVKQVKS